MSELRSALDGFRSETLAELPDARLEEDFAELHRAGEALEAERLRRLAELERRRVYERDGHLSAAAWLVSAFKVAWGMARDHLRMARGLEEMPETRRAVEEGEVSMSAVRILVAARDADPTAFARCERELVEAARIHSANDLGRVAAYWRQAVEREQALDGEEKLRARRRLHASVTFLVWSGSMGTWTPRPGRACSRRCGPCSMRSRGPADRATSGPRPSGGPTPWGRSAGSGWTQPTGPAWEGRSPTSR